MLATRIVVCLLLGGGRRYRVRRLAFAYRTRPVFVLDADNDPVTGIALL